jgi:hypothetical protein
LSSSAQASAGPKTTRLVCAKSLVGSYWHQPPSVQKRAGRPAPASNVPRICELLHPVLPLELAAPELLAVPELAAAEVEAELPLVLDVPEAEVALAVGPDELLAPVLVGAPLEPLVEVELLSVEADVADDDVVVPFDEAPTLTELCAVDPMLVPVAPALLAAEDDEDGDFPPLTHPAAKRDATNAPLHRRMAPLPRKSERLMRSAPNGNFDRGPQVHHPDSAFHHLDRSHSALTRSTPRSGCCRTGHDRCSWRPHRREACVASSRREQ